MPKQDRWGNRWTCPHRRTDEDRVPSGFFEGARAGTALLGGGFFGGLQFEVEVDFGELAAVEATGAGGVGVVVEVDVGDEFVAGA